MLAEGLLPADVVAPPAPRTAPQPPTTREEDQPVSMDQPLTAPPSTDDELSTPARRRLPDVPPRAPLPAAPSSADSLWGPSPVPTPAVTDDGS